MKINKNSLKSYCKKLTNCPLTTHFMLSIIYLNPNLLFRCHCTKMFEAFPTTVYTVLLFGAILLNLAPTEAQAEYEGMSQSNI